MTGPQRAIWPKGPVRWLENRTLFISVPFTWNVPQVLEEIRTPSPHWDIVIVGGPGVYLMKHMFEGIPNVTIGRTSVGVLQRINPLATRTTLGCPNSCAFCAVRRLEGKFRTLDDWPDLPILADNNLLAAPIDHFDKVINRLKVWGWADFNQGIDSRLLTPYHALRIAEIKRPLVKLGFDDFSYQKEWELAVNMLIEVRISKSNIRSLTLIGFNTGPEEAWERCHFVKNKGLHPAPMWFHELDALDVRTITPRQRELGWTNAERVRITGYFYAGKMDESRAYVQAVLAHQKYWYFENDDESEITSRLMKG